MRTLTEAEREALLTDAVEAVWAWLSRDRAMAEDDVARLRRRTSQAVTAAVVKGGHIHTLITSRAQCVGMRVVELIDDDEAFGRAMSVERNAAKNYVGEVTRRVVAHVKGVVGPGEPDHGKVTQLHKLYGVSRTTIYAWLALPDGSAPTSTE